MGFSIKQLTFKERFLLYMTEQELAGPWFSFKITGKNTDPIPVLLKNVEPTPIFQMINTRKGTYIDRITLDFDINEYLKKFSKEHKVTVNISKKNSRIRLYIDVFNRPKVPYINAFFTLKNISDYNLIDFSMYFIFDFDINGLDGFDNDLAKYDEENDVIYQYDNTELHAGFSPISRSTNYESCLTKDFKINLDKLDLSNTVRSEPGEILSALQIKFKTLEPQHSFQTALTISGGFSKKELIDNIIEGKSIAIRYLAQVNKSIKSSQRNKQEEAFVKINKFQSVDCS
jgi:hypothetical protein